MTETNNKKMKIQNNPVKKGKVTNYIIIFLLILIILCLSIFSYYLYFQYQKTEQKFTDINKINNNFINLEKKLNHEIQQIQMQQKKTALNQRKLTELLGKENEKILKIDDLKKTNDDLTTKISNLSLTIRNIENFNIFKYSLASQIVNINLAWRNNFDVQKTLKKLNKIKSFSEKSEATKFFANYIQKDINLLNSKMFINNKKQIINNIDHLEQNLQFVNVSNNKKDLKKLESQDFFTKVKANIKNFFYNIFIIRKTESQDLLLIEHQQILNQLSFKISLQQISALIINNDFNSANQEITNLLTALKKVKANDNLIKRMTELQELIANLTQIFQNNLISYTNLYLLQGK